MPKKDYSQAALAAVERIIGEKLVEPGTLAPKRRAAKKTPKKAAKKRKTKK